MRKALSIMLVITLCFSLSACLKINKSGSYKDDELLIDNSALENIQPHDDFSKELTDAFVAKYQKIDFDGTYNSNTDKIIVHYIGNTTALPQEEQYGLNYYSVRNIDSSEAGYIAACMEETAWSLWGSSTSGINPIIFSGYKKVSETLSEHTCMYAFSYSTNRLPDEFGASFPYEKFTAQTESGIAVYAGPSLWTELGDESAVNTWQEKEKSYVFSKYVEIRQYLNQGAVTSPDNQEIEKTYLVEELLGKSAAEIIAIYGQSYIEITPEGDPPYFYYETGVPYRFVGNAQSTQIRSINANTNGCCIIPNAYIGDSLGSLEFVVLNSGKYTYYPEDNWYTDAEGEYGWVSFIGNGYRYTCYVVNKVVKSFECNIEETVFLPQAPLSPTVNPFDFFIDGKWWDLWSQRCYLIMDVVDNETVQIEINWSSSAAVNTVWHFTGKWDTTTERLYYTNGIKLTAEYVENQQEAQILSDYADGTGYFYFKDSYLYWVDNKENAGNDCYFEPPIQ